MSILTRWLLIPPVNARLIGRYRDYRRHGASAFSATLGCFWMILAWIFIPLEHPRWQRIRAEHKNLYPHINASRPRPLDPVRYLIQTCWLLIGASRKETPKPRRRSATSAPMRPENSDSPPSCTANGFPNSSRVRSK